MDWLAAPGGSLFWILLTVNAFGGGFSFEAALSGDLGLVNYSEAGHHAPAPPAAPTPPDPSLSALAWFQPEERAEIDLSEGAIASQMLASLSDLQFGQGALVRKPAAANIMSESSLATIVRNVRREVYSESRLSYMQRAVEGRELRCSQLASLLGLLTFSDDRIALVEKIGSQVVDAENYPTLYRYFPFESDRTALVGAF